MFKEFALALAATLPFSNANPVPNNPYDSVCHKWPPAADGLKVDLGYGIYEGYHSSTTDLNVWQGWVTCVPPQILTDGCLGSGLPPRR